MGRAVPLQTQRDIRALDSYWAQLRLVYSPFEAHLTGPDPEVYEHEIPGGQLTNMMFQASQLGLGSQWAETKKAYEHANDLLGDIVKVTPTSKVVGDLAQFMVSNKLSPEDVQAKASELDFPGSVLEFLEGMMGQPYGGFPEPLRTDALRGRKKLNERPGLTLPPVDFAKVKKELTKKFGGPVTECDVASYVMYPKVFEDYKKFTNKFGDLSVLPTKYFLSRPEIGEEFHVELEKGKVLILKLLAVGPLSENTGQREVFYEMNGEVRQVTVDDNKASVENVSRLKADLGDSSQVGAPMAGVLVELRVHEGSDVKKGDPLAVLSAMKMVRYPPSLPLLPCTPCFLPILSSSPHTLSQPCKVQDDEANAARRKWSSRRRTTARSRVCWSKRATQSMARTWSAGSSNRRCRLVCAQV